MAQQDRSRKYTLWTWQAYCTIECNNRLGLHSGCIVSVRWDWHSYINTIGKRKSHPKPGCINIIRKRIIFSGCKENFNSEQFGYFKCTYRTKKSQICGYTLCILFDKVWVWSMQLCLISIFFSIYVLMHPIMHPQKINMCLSKWCIMSSL